MKRKLLILFLKCVVGWLSPLNAQQEETITIGTGTSTYNRVPLYSSKSSSSSQLIYTKTDINKADGASISAIAFNQSATDTYGGNIKLKVYMQNTDKESFSSSSDFVSFGDSDLYFDGEIAILDAQSDWVNITLDKSFSYDGNKNLLIGIQHYEGATYSAANFYYTSVSEDRTWHYYNGGTYSTKKYSPNIQLTIAAGDDFTVTATASDTDVYIGETVTLTASATGGSGSYNSYVWDCTSHTLQGTEFWGSGNEYTFMPTATGDYTFTCTVTDSESNTATSDPVIVSVTEQSSTIDLNKQYRIKVSSSPSNYDYDYNGWYLHVNNHDEPNNNPNVGIVSSQQESDDQIFTIEENGSGQYYLKTADGYYIKCATGDQWWCVYAYSTTEKTPLVLEYLSNGVEFYIKDYDKMMGNGGSNAGLTTNNYFKVENSSIYCDASPGKDDDGGYVCTWVLEEYVKPLGITLTASNTSVCKTDAVELTATVDGDGTYYYTWTVTEGSGEFSNATAATTYFTPSSTGNCEIKCSVYDGTSTVEKTISLTVYDVPELTVLQNTIDIEANGTATIELTYSGTNEPNISDWGIINVIDRSVANKLVITTNPLKETTELTFKLYNFDSPYGEYDGVWGYLCAAEETVTINVEEALFVELGTENDVTSICEDDANGIQLVATPKYAAGDVTYSWTSETEGALDMLSATNIANPVFTPSSIDAVSSTVTYKCTVKDDGGAESSETISLTVYDTPEFEDIPSLISAAAGDKVTISVKYSDCGLDYTYYYDSEGNFNPTYTSTDDGAELTYTVEESMNIALSLSSWYNSSCSSTANVRIEVSNENKEVEIGTNEDLSNRNYLPVYTSRNYSITQQIYTAEELGIKESSQINSISFYATWCTTSARNIDVYLVETEEEAFSTTTDFVNMLGTATPNYSGDVSGNVTFVEEGWTTISFTEPFTYEPGTNILVCVNDKTGSTAGAFEFGHYSTTEARSIVRYGDLPYDATNIDINSGYTTDNFLNRNNHIKLGYEANANSELVANISVDNTSLCDGTNGNVFNLWAERVENATYAWYYDDSELPFSEVRETSYSNANPGTYKIKLVVTQNGVSKEAIKELIINSTPNAAVVMGAGGYGFVDETLTYTVNNHIDGTKYAIELVVDGALYPASSNPTDETDIGSHVFDNDGTFYYTVDADRKGCTAEKTHSVIIYPKATFDVNNLCAGQEVEFTNTTYTPNGGWNFGEGEGFVWNFNGEEVVSNNATVTHTFAEAGTYPVTLTVTKSGVSNVATQSVVITASPVVVNLSLDKTTIYEDITFTATSNIDASYIWEIDDVVQDEDEATFTYQFQSLGDHKVAVTAVSATGCSTRREETITITEKSSEPKVMVNNVEVSSIDMGYRPIKAWMRPIDIVITPDGTTNLQINSITIEDNYVELDEHGNVVEGTEMVLNYAMLTSPVNNVTLTPGGEPLSLQLTHDLNNETFYEGFFGGYGADAIFAQESAKMIINYGDGQKKEIQISYIVYEPYEGDVYEKPYVVNSNQYSVTATDMLHNYLLEGATSKHSDAVFKMTIEEGKAADIDVTVTGTNPLVYVYPDDFGGEGGPGLTNYVGYGEQSTGVFFGFEFNFEDATGLSLTDKDGNGNNFVVDYNVSPYYLRSSRTSVFGGTENNQCWTLDKYYVSEEAKLSYDIKVETGGQNYEILLSENDDYSDAVVLKSATQEVNADFETVTLDLSEYAGKKYYFGIRHNSSVNGMIKFDNYRLYEDTRATREGTTFNFMLGEGTYYIVAAAQFENINSSNSFNVTITSEDLKAPEKAVVVSPQDKALGIATTIGQLRWNFGANTEKYQVLFGTTNPPTETMIEWTNYLEANPSCPLRPLATNTVYYWRVNAQNPAGTTEGDVWRFATDFDAPQNLVLTKEVIFINETSELSWTGVDFGDVDGYYNILVDGEKWGESVTKTTTTVELSGLPYKNEPYEIIVEAVYPIDGWDVTAESESVALKVNTVSKGVKGYVYDDYTKEPIQGATVTYGTASATTNESGYYSIEEALAGSYIASASCTGYIRNEVRVDVPTDKEFEQDFYLRSAKTMPEVVATERNEDVVDVEWTLNSISEPMYEDFENGAFKYNWKTSADYPWKVVANGFVDDVDDDDDDYDFFGGFCVKSTNSDYDIDPIDPVTGEKYDDGVYEFGETTSFLELEVYVPYSTTMRFYYRISSTGYLSDYGRFLVNGEQVGENYLGKGSWSRSGYTEYTVDGGQTYTFRWEYEKDGGNYYYEDAFFIDNISFYENANLYNVYVKDILSDAEPTSLATGITAEEYEYTDWATKTDGIYQWGVSAIYNEQGNTLSEDFSDGTMSMGWTKTDSSIGWNNWLILNQQVDSYFQAYDGYSIICSGLDTDDRFYLVTPEIDASIQSTLEFVCIAPQYGDFEEYFNKFRVVYGDTPTGPWTPLTDYNTASVEAWTPMEVSLPLQKTLYIAFENYDHETGYGLGLDNVVVRREAVTGESEIAWSNLIAKGNELVTEGNWNDEVNWSRTHVPTVEEVAVIKAAGTVNEAGAVAKAVLVDNGTLTIGENGVLTASTVIDSVAADITINAGGQLVHSNEGVMATFVKGIQAYTDANNNDGWYTISSPLAADINASDVTNLLSDDFDLYRYDEPTHYWENYEDAEDAEGPDNTDWDNNSAVIEKGRGYLYANKADKQLSFAGELNVADVTTTLSAQASSLKGFNLLGNPFAHNIYKGVAFSGSIADAHYTLNYHGEWQVVTSDNPIKSGAGFLVQATTDADGADLTISKTNAQTRAAANSMLAVTVVNNVFEDVAYVSFNDGIGLEKIGHMNEYAPMVYIPGDFNNYAYATVEEDVTEVPVNFEAMTMGEYTIAVKAKNCEYETMVLVDNLTGKETNLLKDSYTFMATTTDDPDRFVIKLAKDAEVEDSFIYINNGELIFDNLSNDAIINVFDVLGRNVATFNNCGDTTFRVSTDLFADGVYMVRVIEGNNVKVQKMVIE